jgi:hypothetical protein
LESALKSAKRAELPKAPDELIEFVEAHLRPKLADEVGSQLSDVFIDDLTRKIHDLDVGTTRSIPEASRDLKGRPTQPSRPAVAEAPRTQIETEEIVAKRP